MKEFEVSIRDAHIHETATIVHPANIYECEIGENVFVGPFTEVQSDVTVGKNTRIQSHTFICSHCDIGNDCFIGHGVMFVNDKFRGGERAHGNQERLERITLGNNVLVGSGCVILPVKIVDNVTLGAGSVVTRDILEPGVYFGNPARKKDKI